MKHGFTLIELMLVIALTSVLGGIMYMCLFQSQRVVEEIERITNTHMRIIIAQRQLTRDITGAFIPLSTLEPKKDIPKETDLSQNQDKNKAATQASTTSQTQNPEKNNAEKTEEQKKLLAQSFNGSIENEQFKQLLLITANPLEIFWSSTSGRPKPRTEKVTYTLELEKKPGSPSYKLIRTTSYKQAKKETETVQTHELITGIKKMTITYTTVTEEKEKEEKAEGNKAETVQQDSKKQTPAKDNQEKEEKKIEVNIFNDWTVQAMDEKDIRLEKKLPDYVTIMLDLWAPIKDKSESFTIIIPIAWQEIKQTQKKAAPSTLPPKTPAINPLNMQKANAPQSLQKAGKP